MTSPLHTAAANAAAPGETPARLPGVERAYKADLVAFAAGLLRSQEAAQEAAQELVQELFLRIWQQRELWEVAGPLNAYLFRAVRNRAVSELRRARVADRFREGVARREGVVAVVGVPRPMPADGPLRTSDLAGAAERAVAELPERCREVFLLSRAHRLTNAEVASALGISVNTVEVQMTRALAHLRARLTDWRAS